MSYIRSRQHQKTVQIGSTLIALAAIASPYSAHAQDKKAQEKTKAESALPEVSVQASAESPIKANLTSSHKMVKPLLETPQMVSVIKKELLQAQGAFNMMDALRNTPGITMQLGENGATRAGDTFQMRGFASQGSVFVDGVRDLGAVTRDTFNVEQVEVIKGPAGADVGRGAASGYVNLASKMPTLEDATSANLVIGSASNKRLAADVNRKVADTAALRLNAYKQSSDVAGRSHVDNSSYGVAPAFALGLGNQARAYFYSQHLRQNNTPDGGVPTIGLPGFYNANAALKNGARVKSDLFYGSVNDYEKVEADMATAKFEFDLTPNMVLRNISRYGQSSIKRVMTGVYALTGSGAASTWTVARIRQGLDQSNEIAANQTSVNSQFDTGSWKHSLSAGVEILSERQINKNMAIPKGTVVPAANLYQPDAFAALPMPVKNGAYSDGQTKTVAAYVFDGVDVTDLWQLNAGLRYERYNTQTNLISLSTATTAPTLPVGSLLPASLENSGNLLSWKLGSVYKVAKHGRLYGVVATSSTPPGSANFSLSTRPTNVNVPQADPQKTTNLELGTKWDLLNNALALTAAFYRTDNTNEIVQVDAVTNSFAQFGKRRVQGFELGVVGQINPDWQITAGVATMKTKVLQGSTGNNAAGAASRWSPDLTATLWTSYKMVGAWSIGGGVQYTSEQKRVIDPSANLALQNMPAIAANWTANAVVSYQATRNISLQLNLNNLSNKDYIANLNNSGARYTPSTPRTASLSANILF